MSRSILRAALLSASFVTLAAPAWAAAAAAPAAPAPGAATPPPAVVAALPNLGDRPAVQMSLEEAISIALTKGFNIKLQEISLLNSQESWLRAKTEYQPTLTLGPSLSFGGTDGNVRTQSLGLNASLSQKTPIGATVTVSSNLLNLSRRSRTDPTYGSNLQLSFSGLSLLRMNPRYNLNSIRSSRIGFENAYLNYKSQLISIVQGVENAYLSLLQQREALLNAQRQLQIAETTFNATSARANVGTQTELQRNQAELTLLQNRDSFESSKAQLVASEDSLRTLLGGEQYDIGIIPTETIGDYTGPIPTFEESYQRALTNGTQWQTTVRNMENAEASLYVARLNRIPSINLSGSVNSNGSDTDFSPSWRETVNRTDYSWTLNLSASISLPRRNENSNYRTQQNNFRTQQIQMEQTKNGIYTNIRAQIRTINTQKASADLGVKQLEIAERVYAQEEARYNQGLSTYTDLLNAQNNLANSRTTLLSRRVSLRNAINSLRAVEGTTLDRFNIKVPEPTY